MRGALLGIGAIAAALVAGCGAQPAPVPPRPSATPTLERTTATGTRTLTDMAGRTVVAPDRGDRVVVLSPSAAEFVTAFGITPVGRVSDAPLPAGMDAPTAGSSINPDFAAMSALRPDLVIADVAFQASSLRDFDRFAYPVFVIKAGNYTDILATVAALGGALRRPGEAAALAKGIQDRAIAAAVRARQDEARGQPAPSVLIVTGSGREVYAGSDLTYLGSLLQQLAATNVLGAIPAGAPLAGFGVVELGEVAATNPDVVLVILSGAGGVAAQIRGSPAWAGSKAVSGNRVFELDTALFLRSPGPRIGEALDQLYALLYP